MDSSTGTEANKKNIFEELSKEELIRKCYNLLSIAQKAKHSKNVLQEEIDLLKEQLSKTKVASSGSEEIMEVLTQKNLNLTMNVDKLNNNNKSLLQKLEQSEAELREYQEKLYLLDNENSSFKRQIHRLTEENEQLLGNLDALEKQIEKLNQLGVEQQNQLLQLERQQSVGKNEDFEQRILQNEQLNETLETKNNLITELTLKLQERQTNIANANLKEKVKIYHSKIVKFAGIVKNLKDDKQYVLNLLKTYTDQVEFWKNQLKLAKEKCVIYYKNLEIENEELKTKLDDCHKKHNELLCSFEEHKKDMDTHFENELNKHQMELNNINEKTKDEIFYLSKQLEENCVINLDLKCQLDKMLVDIEVYKKQIEELTNEKVNLGIEQLKTQNQELTLENEFLKNQIVEFNNIELKWNNDLSNTLKQIEDYQLKVNNLETEKEINLKQLNDVNTLLSLCNDELNTLKSEHSNVNILIEEHKIKITDYEKLLSELRHEIKSYEGLGIKSSQEIEKLLQENKNLQFENEKLKQELLEIKDTQKDFNTVDCQTDLVLTTELEQLISDLKRENAELLSDMNEMNQELKERGENISKLEAHCEEVLKKLQIYETQANKNIDSISEKEKIIENLAKEIDLLTLNKNENDEVTQLKAEIEMLKEKLNSNLDSSYADTETMSTSTISKTEEMNRLKDLEGSWEERYGKLRTLAIKLKGKIRELNNSLIQHQNDNEELQKKLSINIKTVQNLQTKCDILEDDLDKSQKESKQYLNRLNQVAHDISKDKQQLASKDEVISDLKQKVEQLNQEKQTTDNWKKQVSAKVQTLRKDLESKELIRKELDLKINELNNELQKKDELIVNESESHNQTKALLEQLNGECKKNSMLSLEMQDYERSMKEITKKMEKQQEQVVGLKNQIEKQKSIIDGLKEGNKSLEDKLLVEEHNLYGATSEIGIYKNKISKHEDILKEKDEKIESLTKLVETSRANVEELSIELSKTIAEHQKIDESVKIERDHLRNQNAVLQQNVRELQDDLNLKIEELRNIQKEYAGYKIRAQSVLKQSQNRDVGFEEKLVEEINSLKTKNSTLVTELNDFR